MSIFSKFGQDSPERNPEFFQCFECGKRDHRGNLSEIISYYYFKSIGAGDSWRQIGKCLHVHPACSKVERCDCSCGWRRKPVEQAVKAEDATNGYLPDPDDRPVEYPDEILLLKVLREEYIASSRKSMDLEAEVAKLEARIAEMDAEDEMRAEDTDADIAGAYQEGRCDAAHEIVSHLRIVGLY